MTPVQNNTLAEYDVVDMFCGIGGLTHGFINEGFNVVAGFDTDKTCKYAYENNNNATFIRRDIKEIDASDILPLYRNKNKKILVGCAPCQPFSNLTNKQKVNSKKWDLLYYFSDLIVNVMPEIISMENVPNLMKFNNGSVFKDFILKLEANGYFLWHAIINCPNYGIPQNRKRLVLLGSRLCPINIIPPTHNKDNYETVADTIKYLEHIDDGMSSLKDPLHRAVKLSPLNIKRLKATAEGGSWKDWDDSLILNCHKKTSGKSYGSVYGRMLWNEPSPTMTTFCTGIGNGRFGHPQQDRAISLREAALLQTFPHDYNFIDPKIGLKPSIIARHIGNAVPVTLGSVIARSIHSHLKENDEFEK
ncbi:MAG: DNA (cytosine-5-)-methyltransferase [Candidatus Marinimicrobia bacterium]|nr:DNA (cytosine-5-)-methyltransferase [Candidatus Neomarinimicrobiota bacterium]